MRPARLAVPLARLAVPLALLALTGTAQAGPAERATVELTIHHSRFSTAEIRVRPGTTVRFVVHNTDPIPHELIVGDEAVQDRHERGTESHHGDRPGEVSVAPGQTAETVFTFPASSGRLLFGCHLPGHWAYGMHGTIRVG